MMLPSKCSAKCEIDVSDKTFALNAMLNSHLSTTDQIYNTEDPMKIS